MYSKDTHYHGSHLNILDNIFVVCVSLICGIILIIIGNLAALVIFLEAFLLRKHNIFFFSMLLKQKPINKLLLFLSLNCPIIHRLQKEKNIKTKP